MNTLVIENLSQEIGNKLLLQNISLTVSTGEVIALLGPNGAGKTTLLKTIIGLQKSPSYNTKLEKKNKIAFNNVIINDWPVSKRISLGISYLPQHTSLFQQMSVHDNLELVYEYQDYWSNKPHQLFIDERDKWLTHTHLTSTLTQQAKVLSGGQKRKLEIVRALLMHPTILMLDEPFAGVDPKSIYELKQLFQDMSNYGIGIIISDHHVDQLLTIATKTYVIVQGNVVTSGNIEDILNCDYTKERYLGTQFYNEITQRLTSVK